MGFSDFGPKGFKCELHRPVPARLLQNYLAPVLAGIAGDTWQESLGSVRSSQNVLKGTLSGVVESLGVPVTPILIHPETPLG